MTRGSLVRRALAALALALVLPAGALGQDFADVDEALRDAIASGEIPGAVGLVGRGDQVLFYRAYGTHRGTTRSAPIVLDTVFDIASLTKPLGTTLAVMHLVERGAIDLEAPLGRYLREFDGKAFAGVTVRRILTHTAGFAPIPPNGSVAPGFPEAARALAVEPLGYRPGEGFQYSDLGFILLGEVVRRVAGEPLDRYLARVLFKPLALRDTAFRPETALRERAAPTGFANGALLKGVVHDPRARRLGGVAGHAGMFSTAADLARIVRMLLNGGELDGRRILAPETVQTMWAGAAAGDGVRTLGWDMWSVYSRALSPFFPPGAVGHTGFTGTAVWLDPASRSFVILLTNRVWPGGGGAEAIRELRLRVTAAAGAELFAPRGLPRGGGAADATPAFAEAVTASAGQAVTVRTGLDVLVAQNFAPLHGRSVGLVTNQTGIDAQGRRAIELLAAAPAVKLRAIFSPEHGLTGEATTDVGHGRDAKTRRPIWSLYGPTRRPTPEMLRGIDTLVVDIQDVGVRYYTYLTTLVYVMEEAARHGIAVVVLDRPNPITGRVVEGPVMDGDLTSFTGPYAVPVRTGLTIGEFARLVAGERKLGVDLTVVPLSGWERGHWFDDTGLPWVNPSPNIRSVTQALLYSGIGLLEGTNLSVGRGTDTPFELVGAPWIDGEGLAQAMSALGLPGVRIEPVTFTPTGDKYAGEVCQGVRFRVTDREAIRPVRLGLALAHLLRERHHQQFRPEQLQLLLVHRVTMWALLRGVPIPHLWAWADADHVSFLNRRASYLIYR